MEKIELLTIACNRLEIIRWHVLSVCLNPFSLITNENKEVCITPMGDAPTYVNGDLITSSTQLHHVSRMAQKRENKEKYLCNESYVTKERNSLFLNKTIAKSKYTVIKVRSMDVSGCSIFKVSESYGCF